MMYKENDKVWIENIQHITDVELIRNPQVVENVTLAPVIDDKGEMNHVQVIYLKGLPFVFTGDELRPYKTEQMDVNISEGDIEDFQDVVFKNETFSWVFKTHNGVDVNINFMSDDEYEQRGV